MKPQTARTTSLMAYGLDSSLPGSPLTSSYRRRRRCTASTEDERGRGLVLDPDKTAGPLQSQLGGALNPVWGNSASTVVTIRVPAGTTIYEGTAASQPLAGGGSLLGGGSQVYIPRVDASWLVP